MPRNASIQSGQLQFAGLIGNVDCDPNKPLHVDKMRHLFQPRTSFALAIGATPVAREEIVFVASFACTVRGFHAILNDTGTTTDVDFDLKKNGTTILTGTVNITNADADRAVKDGTISSADLVAGDVLSIELTVTTSTGAQGPFAWVNIEENGAAS